VWPNCALWREKTLGGDINGLWRVEWAGRDALRDDSRTWLRGAGLGPAGRRGGLTWREFSPYLSIVGGGVVWKLKDLNVRKERLQRRGVLRTSRRHFNTVEQLRFWL
jgi:hypothetical protein